MSKLQEAIALATRLHRGQTDKAGKPYIEHPLRVMNSIEGETEKIVAVLHDVLEDCDIKFSELLDLFGYEIARAVLALSKSPGEDYFEFINQIRLNAIATRVKIADLKDNMNLERLPQVTEKDLERNQKYAKALKILGGDR